MRIGFPAGFAFCALVAASAASGQQAPTDPATILKSQGEQTARLAASWLHSGDPRLQAWGAYVALRDHDKQFVPDLVGMVSSYEVTGWPVLNTRQDAHDAMLAVLDAVIQMDGEVTASDAAKLYSEFPTQSLILLSRAGDDSNSALLEIFRTEQSNPLAWLTAGDLLTRERVPGFAAAVLGGMTIHAAVTVTDPDRFGAWGSGTSCCGGFGMVSKAGWPEIGTYELAEGSTGAVLLADGADPAFYVRKISAQYTQTNGGSCGFGNLNSERADLIREHFLTKILYASEDDPPLRSSIGERIVWENGDAYLASLHLLVQQQPLKLADALTKLKEAGLMTAEEAAAVKLRIEITIRDDRENRTVPLPRAENLGDNVIVKM